MINRPAAHGNPDSPQLIVTLLPIRSLFVLMSAWNDSTLSSYQRPSFTPLRGRVLVSPCLTRK
jgi:hypothetical protein